MMTRFWGNEAETMFCPARSFSFSTRLAAAAPKTNFPEARSSFHLEAYATPTYADVARTQRIDLFLSERQPQAGPNERC
jgi:hypothetical protein